ncbi:hypothetical protein HETIRDRAFT_450191 [Heterobasidion irregulare TC 32-1]|uniref:Retrotransposon gag domain-containing protein n=1 Tax=Heterobasidion irregulare (strain TC 32-1) TaxID=747525 RepID=W4KG88_HETIT|nr:uncharacterized protein HETIRDRAFT_450191 [Heterobasidion irregulare TC 32-1]ETW84847.1 hypothetical protein HETIRDRAFT_450191 [Heterobasidion irregulare TC 32-1]
MAVYSDTIITNIKRPHKQDLGQEYPPGTRHIDNQLRHNNRPIRHEGDFWVYEDNNRYAPPNYDNCSYRNGRYYFTLEDGTEEEDIWNETEAQWELAPQYREPAPVIPEDSEQEETTSESDSDSPDQTPINTQNKPLAEMSGQASTSTDPPSATVQPGRGKVKLPDNYTGNRIESQKFMLQCLLLFAAESDRYKTNQDKISLVLSCMRYGTAGAWAENFLLKSRDFLTKFKLQFRETGKTDKARSALMAFSQGRMTVDEYSNQFILIAADADISDKEQVPYFQRGLDPRVMDKIYDKEVQPKDTIQDWINTACEIDGRLRARLAQKAILANSTSFRSDYLNRFHTQPAVRYNSTTAPQRMNNQVFEETRRDAWVRQGEETAWLIWKEKTTHPLWETKREYIEEWRQRMFLAMTSGYHNLVLRWNVFTLPHPDDPKQTMGNALCYLTDDRETEASVILLESEQCLEN